MNMSGFWYIESANKCTECGQAPNISETESPIFFDSRAYEMYCKSCKRSSGSWPSPEEAKISWDRLNPIRLLESNRIRVSEINSIKTCIAKLEEAAQEVRGALNVRWNGRDYGSSPMPSTLVQQIKEYEYGISRLQYLLMPKIGGKETI